MNTIDLGKSFELLKIECELIKFNKDSLIGSAIKSAIASRRIVEVIAMLKELIADAPGLMEKHLGRDLFNKINNF